MDNKTIIFYLCILLVSIIILYYFSKLFSMKIKRQNLKKTVHKNVENNLTETTTFQNYQMKQVDESLNNNYKLLSLTDIIENKIPKYEYIKDNNITDVITISDDSLNEESKNNEVTVDIEPQINPLTSAFGSYIIGEISENIVVKEQSEKKILQDDNIEQSNNKEKSTKIITDNFLTNPKSLEISDKNNNYINYKPKNYQDLHIEKTISLNNEKCAYFQYDLLPEWLKEFLKIKGYQIMITEDEELLNKNAILYSPIELTEQHYIIYDGHNEQGLEDKFLLGIGYFIDNYLGIESNAPITEESNVQFYSSNAHEWSNIWRTSKENISAYDFFAKIFREYIIDKEKLKNENNKAYQFMHKCIKLVEFNYFQILNKNENNKSENKKR